jgi:hypothetical protein
VALDPYLLATHFRRKPWLPTKNDKKNDILYIGITMVWMILLKRRVKHETTNGTAFSSLLCLPHLPRPPQHHIIVPPPTSTGMGMPRHQWEKGSTPKKNHPPTTCTTRCSTHRQTRALKQPPPVINYRHHSCFLIQWLYLRHRFL